MKIYRNNLKQASLELVAETDLGCPDDPRMGGVEPPILPSSYGIGQDLNHQTISAENPVIWKQDNGNSGRNS